MRYQPTECILTEDELRERCAEWQTALYLSDWSVALAVVRAREMELTNNQGECEWTRSTRLANVRLLDPADFPPGPWPYDMEAVLVHELLHLHFAPFAADDRPDGPDGIAQEQAIDSIARALVALKRVGETTASGGVRLNIGRDEIERELGDETGQAVEYWPNGAAEPTHLRENRRPIDLTTETAESLNADRSPWRTVAAELIRTTGAYILPTTAFGGSEPRIRASQNGVGFIQIEAPPERCAGCGQAIERWQLPTTFCDPKDGRLVTVHAGCRPKRDGDK